MFHTHSGFVYMVIILMTSIRYASLCSTGKYDDDCKLTFCECRAVCQSLEINQCGENITEETKDAVTSTGKSAPYAFHTEFVSEINKLLKFR